MAAVTAPADAALHCLGLTKRYGDVTAVDGVDLALAVGETLAVVGPSGCGKTTLLRLIAGLEVPDGGTVRARDETLAGPGVLAPPERRRIGFVFQDYALFPHLPVAQNVGYGLRGSMSERVVRAHDLMELVGIAHLRDRMPEQLSGGEQQRVSLARALAPRPDVLLMDEPFSNIDTGLRVRVRREIKDVLRQAGVAVVFVTHDQEEALFMGDRVAVMRDGRIEQVDTPFRMFHAPATSFVGHFLGTADFLPARIVEGTLMTEIGPVDAPAPDAISGGPEPEGAEPRMEVMVRPDDLSLRAEEPGQGVVEERVFTGPSFLYTVRLDSGSTCHAIEPHTADPLDAGSRVAVEVAAGHALATFVDGRTIVA